MFKRSKAHIIPVLASVGIAALTACGVAQQADPQGPGYVRISLSEKSAVYLEFQAGEVRAAMSAEGLSTAPPIRLGATAAPQEITLPIPADQLPAGLTAVKAGLRSPQAVGYLALCRTDARRTEWQCVARVSAEAADSAAKAPAIRLPDLAKLRFSIEGRPDAGSLGVGVRLLTGTTELLEVRKDGKAVDVQVTVTDASGKQAGSTKGPLAGLGFG